MKNVLLVALGGALGSTARYLTSTWVQKVTTPHFPFGTLMVNVAGCLCIGLLGGLGERRLGLGPEVRAFAMIGVLGGFTTFSSFAYDTLMLGRDIGTFFAFANVAGHLLLCLGAAWLGLVLARLA